MCARETAFPKERTFLAHAAGDPSANHPRFHPKILIRGFTRSDCGSGRRQVQLFRKDRLRRPQRPSFLQRAEAHLLKTLPPVHPREPPVTASSATVASRLNATHACTVSTVREGEIYRNGKLMLSCAETVEDGTSLWKEKENTEKISRQGQCGRTLLSADFQVEVGFRIAVGGTVKH